MLKGRREFNEKQRNKPSPIEGLLNEIKKANSLKEVLIPEEYALPGGWADRIASVIIEDEKKKSDKNKKKASMNSYQLRKIFTQLKNIEKEIDRSKDSSEDKNFKLTSEQKNIIFLLMPQIAYARGRQLISESFYNLLKECISTNKIVDEKDYKSFVRFYEAIIAYSKMYN